MTRAYPFLQQGFDLLEHLLLARGSLPLEFSLPPVSRISQKFSLPSMMHTSGLSLSA